MHRLRLHRPAGIKARPLIAALAAAASCGAWADEPSPYYIGVTASLTHDSNVYRIPESTVLTSDRSRSDTYWGTGLVGGFDQSIGRQHLYAAAKLNLNQYQHNDTLNNTSYGVNAGWDWATIERLSGGVTADVNQSLASYDNSSTAEPTIVRNILKTEQLAARVRWGGDGVLNLDGAYAHSHVSYSATPTSESSQDSGSIGASYRVGPTLRLGIGLRLSHAVAPNAVPIVGGGFEANKTDGRNLDFSADWRPSAQTGLNARLSWTRQTNSGISERDFSGLTGALGASYAPTSKLSFSASLSRDAGTNSSFFNLANTTAGQPVSGLSESSRTTDSLALGAAYAATAKIGITAGLQYRHNKVADQTTVAGTATNNDHNDNTRSVSIGANYAIARNGSLACNLAYVSRGVSGTAAFSYSANTAMCSAQFVLR